MFLAILLLAPLAAFCGDQGISVGYGMAAFNMQRSFGHLQGGKPYGFIQTTYVFERPFSTKELALLLEPFGSYVTKPTEGFDLGFDLGLKYYPWRTDTGGFYMTAGPGLAYTTIGFQEQGDPSALCPSGRNRVPVQQFLHRGPGPPLFERRDSQPQLVGQRQYPQHRHHVLGSFGS